MFLGNIRDGDTLSKVLDDTQRMQYTQYKSAKREDD
jgi:hypothetical protein